MKTRTKQHEPLYKVLSQINSLTIKLLRSRSLSPKEIEQLKEFSYELFCRDIPIK